MRPAMGTPSSCNAFKATVVTTTMVAMAVLILLAGCGDGSGEDGRADEVVISEGFAIARELGEMTGCGGFAEGWRRAKRGWETATWAQDTQRL